MFVLNLLFYLLSNFTIDLLKKFKIKLKAKN